MELALVEDVSGGLWQNGLERGELMPEDQAQTLF